MNQYIKNLETDKIELHFDKQTYTSAPEEIKRSIKSKFLFSGKRKAWVSRAKSGNVWGIDEIIKALNLLDGGTTGEKISFAETVQREQQRAASKVEIMESRYNKANRDANAQFQRADTLASVIPMGQPILVGHHSERGHRNHLKKIDNSMRKGFELRDKANYYANKTNNAESTAAGEKFKNEGYLVNRIKESKATIRVYERRLQGKFYYYSQPEPVSDENKKYWEQKIAEETERLNFFTGKLIELNQNKNK